ncbi:phytoene desaturase family protein [Kribbia dieselivorans]|uniref:phytoene desaturase family protein n=1 Tax=Kribbia dieselivorans TaxID=331526 RepID=UPI000838A751|nr:NAD(P)/FAD-dependent oxidoreductase [Kribbia dieselivorans]
MTRSIVVGSGPNGLTGAITLAAAGLDVTVLEAAETPGGGLRSHEATVPGLIHDMCSAFHPLSTRSSFARRFDLTQHGLQWAWPSVQYAHPLDDGTGGAALRSVDETAAGLGVDGAAYRRLFGPLAGRFDELAADILRPVLHVPRHPVTLARYGLASTLPATTLARWWQTPQARGLWAGVAAHAFHPLTSPMSSAAGLVLGTATHRYGWPVAVGGSGAIARAMIALLTSLGGRIETGVRVESYAPLADADVVLLDTSPRAATAILGDRLPARVARAYRRYRHGPGAFQVSLAVEGGIPWTYEPARRSGTVHVGGTLEEITEAERSSWSGQMPARPFVLVGQQAVADPSRARGDVQPIDAYAHVPHGFTGDATTAILDQIERFAPGTRERIVAVSTRSTAQLERENANLIGGDISNGANTALQLVFRPRVALDPYSTGVPGVYLCSSATPPGGGAHGLCGYGAAQAALARL